MTKPPEAAFRYGVIATALRCAGGTSRTAVVRGLAAKSHVDWRGRERRFTERTLWRWISKVEREGRAGLARRENPNKGRTKCVISRAYDAAVGFDRAVLEWIRAELVTAAKSHYAAGSPSRRQVAHSATRLLVKITRDKGCDLSDQELRKICRVSESFVRPGRHYRVLAIKAKDAKRYADDYLIRVRRNRDGLPPMGLVCADVHHLDVLLRRVDGSVFTPKLIAFHDLATNRLFFDVVFLPPRQGVRQEHVVRAFIAMTQDPAWGMPAILLIDHGGEFGKLDLIGDAMKLAGKAHAENARVLYSDDNPDMEAFVAGELEGLTMAVRKARPYNAAAKPIEGIFGVLEQWTLSRLPGWIAGDRMAMKTQNVGRAPDVFPGGSEQFTSTLVLARDYLHGLPQRGSLRGRSPREAFEAAVRGGWQRVDVSEDALHEVFSVAAPCTVRQGAVTIKGRRYTAPILSGLLVGTKLMAKVPIARDRVRIALRDEHDGLVGFVEPVPTFNILDRRGAHWSARQAKEQTAVLRQMRVESRPIDLVEDMRAAVAGLPPAPVARSAGIVTLHKHAEETAARRRLLPAPGARPGGDRGRELWARLAAGLPVIESAGGIGPPAETPVPGGHRQVTHKARRK